jgi:hypothetical protein
VQSEDDLEDLEDPTAPADLVPVLVVGDERPPRVRLE